jgi:hypothetical protein
MNAFLLSQIHDRDTVDRRADGLIGVQVLIGPPTAVQYRNILVRGLGKVNGLEDYS